MEVNYIIATSLKRFPSIIFLQGIKLIFFLILEDCKSSKCMWLPESNGNAAFHNEVNVTYISHNACPDHWTMFSYHHLTKEVSQYLLSRKWATTVLKVWSNLHSYWHFNFNHKVNLSHHEVNLVEQHCLWLMGSVEMFWIFKGIKEIMKSSIKEAKLWLISPEFVQFILNLLFESCGTAPDTDSQATFHNVFGSMLWWLMLGRNRKSMWKKKNLHFVRKPKLTFFKKVASLDL